MGHEPEDLNPGKLLSTSSAYWESSVLHAAVKLDVFTMIGAESLATATIAQKLKADTRRLEALLNALVAMELLERKRGDGYANTTLSTTFLSQASPRYIGHIIKHHYHLVESWSHLDEMVITGEPVRRRVSQGGEVEREAFLMGMFNLATQLASSWAEKIDLGGRKRLLDLGGGPGTWAIYFALAHPELSATVFDLPSTQPFAEKTIASFNVGDRVDFQGGDYLEDELGRGYEVVWMSQVLHSEGPDNCSKLIEKAVSSLVPGGLVMIHEFLLNDDLVSPLFPALFSLNMALGTTDGRAYSEGQLRKMLESAGLSNISRLPFTAPNGSSILAGCLSAAVEH